MDTYHIPKGFFECYEKKLFERHKNTWNREHTTKKFCKHIKEEDNIDGIDVVKIIYFSVNDTLYEIKNMVPHHMFNMSQDVLQMDMFMSFKACAEKKK